MTVEIFHRGQRVAAHVRSAARGQHTTLTAHMPKAHQQHREWNPSRLIAWAETVGPQTAAFLKHGLDRCPWPEAGSVPTARPVVHDQLRGPTYYQ